MKSLRLLLLLILPLISGAQTLTGIIYDAEATIKGAKLINTSQNILSYSDDKGVFQIGAKVNDTIVITSYFHHIKTHIVTLNDFNSEIVIELKKITNELDEVEVIKINEKVFDSVSFSKTTAKQGQTIVKDRVFRSGTNYQPTLDVMALARVIGKLFKKKKVEIKKAVKIEDLQRIFQESSLFTNTFLRDDLKVSEDYEFLFFEYCSVQNMNVSLLLKSNEFLLLEELIIYSKAFNKLVEEHKKD